MTEQWFVTTYAEADPRHEPTPATTAPLIDLDPSEPSGMFRCDHGTVFDRGEDGWELIVDTGCPCFYRTEG